MSPQISLICFFGAVIHSFATPLFNRLAARHPEGSAAENALHLLGEVEVVFGLWAMILVAASAVTQPWSEVLGVLEGLSYDEPIFLFVILGICSSRPILDSAERLLLLLARLLPLPGPTAFVAVTLAVGPLLGSLLTEPAAMTVCALLLKDRLFSAKASRTLKYAALGTLFVNVSIGGTLTPYAAPPVLMVARSFGWGPGDMLTLFGTKAVVTCVLTTSLLLLRFRGQLPKLSALTPRAASAGAPVWLMALHWLLTAGIVVHLHHPVVFVGLFLLWLGIHHVTREHQKDLELDVGLRVAFFLGGLVVLGSQQSGWLGPLLGRLGTTALYFGAAGLTAFVDNAALTYLGSLVPDLSEASRYALVAGSVVGGGLTVMANAPNPAGTGLLGDRLGPTGLSPLSLLLGAMPPTLIALALFWA